MGFNNLFINEQRVLSGIAESSPIPPYSSLIRKTIKYTWPAVTECFLMSLVGLVDIIMVSSIGTQAIAAVGVTVQPKFFFLAVFFAITTSVSAIVARRKGENNNIAANLFLKQALVITAVFTVLISIVGFFFAREIFVFLGAAQDIIADSVQYFQIIISCIAFVTIPMTINAAHRGVGNTKIAMRTNIVANAVNILFNYLLIGGNFGFPALGVKGAAIATVLGSFVAFLLSVRSITAKNNYLNIFAQKGITFEKQALVSMARLSSGSLVEQLFLRIGFLLYAIIVIRLGTRSFAIHQIGINVLTISFAVGDGLAIASVALVGQSLGQKRADIAKIYATICQRIGLILSVILSLTFVLLNRQIVMLFTKDAEIISTGGFIITLVASVLFLQIPSVVYSGSLRGAGDTKFVAFVSFITIAVFRPLFSYILCFVFDFGLQGAWYALVGDQFLRLFLLYYRFSRNKWLSIKI